MKEKAFYFATEEITTKRRVAKITVPQEFVQVYRNLYAYTKNLPHSCINPFIWIMTNCYKDGSVYFTPEFTVEFEKETGLKKRMLARILKQLSDEHLLIKVGRAHYRINPKVIWQESQGERAKTINSLKEGGHDLSPTDNQLTAGEEEGTLTLTEETTETYTDEKEGDSNQGSDIPL